MALVPSRSDEIEKLTLSGDLDPVTFDLDLDLDPLMSVPKDHICQVSFHSIQRFGGLQGQTNMKN